jgi:hypothetical protein
MAVSDPRTDIPAVTRAGWRCPECKTVYSPDVRQCDCATVKRSFAERVHWGNSGGSCTCTPYGLGTVHCPVHQGARSAAVCTCPSDTSAYESGANVAVSHVVIYPAVLPAYRVWSHYVAAVTGFGLIWGGIMPPPACPAHGQTEIFRVTC